METTGDMTMLDEIITRRNQVPLGPATILAVEGDGRVRVSLPGKPSYARLALAQPCRLEPGDQVLVIGDDDAYVIGVLKSRGTSLIETEGDLEIRASGRIRLTAGQEVELVGPRVAVKADRLETTARQIVEKVETAFRWITATLHTRAGRVRTMVSGHSLLRAERIVEQADKDVKIDGRKIHLG